jgi:hypothetical protein
MSAIRPLLGAKRTSAANASTIADEVLPYQQEGAGRFRRSAQLFNDDVFGPRDPGT